MKRRRCRSYREETVFPTRGHQTDLELPLLLSRHHKKPRGKNGECCFEYGGVGKYCIEYGGVGEYFIEYGGVGEYCIEYGGVGEYCTEYGGVGECCIEYGGVGECCIEYGGVGEYCIEYGGVGEYCAEYGGVGECCIEYGGVGECCFEYGGVGEFCTEYGGAGSPKMLSPSPDIRKQSREYASHIHKRSVVRQLKGRLTIVELECASVFSKGLIPGSATGVGHCLTLVVRHGPSVRPSLDKSSKAQYLLVCICDVQCETFQKDMVGVVPGVYLV
ncbi:hypothetical protein STEG23_020777 [Scotinomys teguina]